MGENASARTERELAALRGEIDRDLATLRARISDDLDPRHLAARQPLAVFGTLGSLIAVVGVAFASRVRNARRSRGEKELDQIIERVGGRLDRLKGRSRKRLRDSLRREIGEVEQGPKAQQALFTAVTTAVTAALTLVARRFASRLVGDEELPEDS